MHFPIKIITVIMIILIAFLVFITLITNWGETGNSMFDGITKWFKGLNPEKIQTQQSPWGVLDEKNKNTQSQNAPEKK